MSVTAPEPRASEGGGRMTSESKGDGLITIRGSLAFYQSMATGVGRLKAQNGYISSCDRQKHIFEVA
jgi:hypothetical protein